MWANGGFVKVKFERSGLASAGEQLGGMRWNRYLPRCGGETETGWVWNVVPETRNAPRVELQRAPRSMNSPRQGWDVLENYRISNIWEPLPAPKFLSELGNGHARAD